MRRFTYKPAPVRLGSQNGPRKTFTYRPIEVPHTATARSKQTVESWPMSSPRSDAPCISVTHSPDKSTTRATVLNFQSTNDASSTCTDVATANAAAGPGSPGPSAKSSSAVSLDAGTNDRSLSVTVTAARRVGWINTRGVASYGFAVDPFASEYSPLRRCLDRRPESIEARGSPISAPR